MAFNGNGVFSRLYSWVNDAAGGIKIRADRMDNEMNGFATGLSTCITKDGQTTVTANLPMAGYRHTGVGNGSARNDYASLAQVQDGKSAWVDGGGTADAITATYSPVITTLVDGQLCYVRATAANATTTPTFSPNALTARTIVKNGGSALAAGDIAGDGHELELRYDLTNTRWELLNPKAPTVGAALTDLSTKWTAASASSSASLQFHEDTDNGTNKATLTAPASLAADATITLPSADGTLATLAGTETLTNKTLTSPAINGATIDTTTTGVTQSAGDNSTKLATTAYADAVGPKAWVNFNGNTGTINADYNVTSITKNGTGDYTINFTNALPDANYAYVFGVRYDNSSADVTTVTIACKNTVAPTTTALRIVVVGNLSATLFDALSINVVIFG